MSDYFVIIISGGYMTKHKIIKEATQKKYSRMWAVINDLQGRGLNIANYAKKAGVSAKTIKRDIDELKNSGYPIESFYPGVYNYVEGFSPSRFKLNPRDAACLSFIRALAGNFGKDLQNAFAQFESRICQSVFPNPFYIHAECVKQKVNDKILSALQEAVINKTVINIWYKSDTPHFCNRIKPLKIMFFNGLGYLVALNDEQDTVMKFLLDKIKKVVPTDKKFNYKGHIIKVLNSSTSIWFGLNKNIKIKLAVKAAAAKYFRRKNCFPCQKIEKVNKDGSLILSCAASDFMEVLPEVKRWIPLVKVIEPAALAREVKAQVEEYLREIKG